MGFKPIRSIDSGVEFNSAVSSNFKDLYDKIFRNKCLEELKHQPSKTFAPSSFRCDRVSYFRLRGVPVDDNLPVNTGLTFKAHLGTACHEEIQRNLIDSIGDQWVPIPEFLDSHPIPYDYTISHKNGLETQLRFTNPPVNFACDGILRIEDNFYLLEIKTCEYSTFKKLSQPKDEHVDQIKCYCSLLNLNKALVLYQERNSGEIKCFEMSVTDKQMQEVLNKMNRVLDCVKSNIAPPRLPSSDPWCSYCKYRVRCKQWG